MIDKERAYRLMVESRELDHRCKELLAAGTPVPNYHSGIGQEAMAVGMGLATEPHDSALFTYRDFGVLLARGVTLTELAGDLVLTTAGTTAGHGGIMHVSAPDRGLVGRNSVFGSRFGIALGLAHAARIRGLDQAVLCPFGEAEGGRGVLYEAVNIAILHRLPLVFVAENNGFSISSRTEDIYAGGEMSALLRGAPLPVSVVDGNDVEIVHAATSAAMTHARSGAGPCLLEIKTYRIDPHIPADDDSKYRTADEVEARRADDPIERCRRRVLESSALDEARLEQIASTAVDQVSAAFTEALAAPPPAIEDMYGYLYYQDGPWPARIEDV